MGGGRKQIEEEAYLANALSIMEHLAGGKRRPQVLENKNINMLADEAKGNRRID